MALNAEVTEFSLADGALSEKLKGATEEEVEYFCCNYMNMKVQGQGIHHSDATVLFLILLLLPLFLPPELHQHILSCILLNLAWPKFPMLNRAGCCWSF